VTESADEGDLIRVVLADANVLYSRVLRDYLLHAAAQEVIAIAWSAQIHQDSPPTPPGTPASKCLHPTSCSAAS
jgi:hypothetical protein